MESRCHNANYSNILFNLLIKFESFLLKLWVIPCMGDLFVLVYKIKTESAPLHVKKKGDIS